MSSAWFTEMDKSEIREMVTEDLNCVNNIEFIEVECDVARVETSNEEDEQNINSMELVGDTSVEADELMVVDSTTNESDSMVISNVQSLRNLTGNIDVDDTDLENDSLRGITSYQFKIEKLSEIPFNTNRTSPIFKCRNLPFHLLVIRRGKVYKDYLSVFLQRGIPEDYEVLNDNEFQDDSGLEIVVTVTFSLIDPLSERSWERTIDNHLYQANANWGFNDFICMKALFMSEFCVDDSIIIDVNMKAEPPFCRNYKSRAITGHVGLRNQGATCYMNSLLEVLFFLTKFRTACYRIPTEMDDHSSMALALQKVFYKLQISNEAVSTITLTKSFGWTTVDVLMQHDIQEFMRILIDKIESRMKNTLLENVVPSMFQGAVVSYVKCRNIDYASQREEIFYDIQLNLENVNNIYDAFKKYVTPEIMDDDNKYHAGSFGLQTADKGTLFMNFPPVMFLHLLRFQFDGNLNMAIKNNNFFEFYYHIDLTDYVHENNSTSSKYTLFAVLAHSGSGSYGHYTSYINPSLDGNWLKFDDDIISIVHPFDVINGNFGFTGKNEWTTSQQANAYMLVYIRDSDANEILAPVDRKYISEELINSVNQDQINEDNIDWNTNNYYSTDLYIFLNAQLESGIGFEGARYMTSMLPKFNVESDISISNFKKLLIAAFTISNKNQLRIWPINPTPTSPCLPFHISDDDDKLVAMLTEFGDRYQHSYAVWIEIALPGSELQPFNPCKDVLIFYYFYCGSQCRTHYIDYGIHDRMSKVADLVPCLNQLMQWSNLELNIYEDCGKGRIRELVMTDFLKDGINPRCNTFVMNIVFEPTEHDHSMSLHSAYLYYEDIRNRVTLTLKNEDDRKDKGVIFFIHLNTTFPELVNQLATRLKYDREKIQIYTWDRRYAIPSTSTETLSTLLGINQEKPLFYKLHQVNTIDVETKKPFKFQGLSIDMKKTETFTIYISDDETISSILAEARKLLQPYLADGFGKFRILRVIDNKRLMPINDPKQIHYYLDVRSNRNYFRIEEIPKGDDALNENEIFTTVFHFNSATTVKTTEYPFIFKINLDEQWQVVKERIRLRLKLSKAAWQKYRPVIFSSDYDDELEIEDTTCIGSISKDESNYVIGLDHQTMERKKPIRSKIQSNQSELTIV